MKSMLMIAMLFISAFATAANRNYSAQPDGTIARMKSQFDGATRIASSDLQGLQGTYTCLSYDKNLKEEFAQEHTVKITLDSNAAILTFDGQTSNAHRLIDQGVDLQATKSLLIMDDTKMDIFITARKTTGRAIMLKTAVFQTKGTTTSFLDGVIYSCK